MSAVRGIDTVAEQLRAVGAELAGKALARAARKAFEPVLKAAKQSAPRDTGELAASLRLAVRVEGGTIVVGIRFGGRGVKLPAARRWHFIELGTSKQRAQPFLRPALDSNQVVDTLKDELRGSIGRALRRR